MILALALVCCSAHLSKSKSKSESRSCLQNLRFNKHDYVILPHGWSVIEESVPTGLPQYYFSGASWNYTGRKHSICSYALLYPGGDPGDLSISYNKRVHIESAAWSEVSGMNGVYGCEALQPSNCRWKQLA
jgi:hypothetical protein